MEEVLRINQNGFRKNRSTIGQILTVRRLIEGVQAKNLEAAILFVDFTKAFDSVHRGKMSRILRAYGIPEETVTAIMILYQNTKAMVRSPDGDTEFFDIEAGVLQGDTLAPFLFIICLDYIMRTTVDTQKELGFTLAHSRSSRYPTIKITDADYADDIALFADKIEEAETLLHGLEEVSAEIGLYVNAKKTEYMCFNQEGSMKARDGTTLKQVEEFTYLGSNIASTEKDVNIGIGKAWSALDAMKILWKSDLPEHLKREFFKATVETILLYGSTAWTLTSSLESKLDGTYTRMLRAVLDISWEQHPTRKRLYGKLPTISSTIREQRTQYAGHCWRSKGELVSDLLLWTPKHGHTRVGRPCRTYIEQLLQDTGWKVEELKSVKAAMEDRDVWRQKVTLVRATSPT